MKRAGIRESRAKILATECPRSTPVIVLVTGCPRGHSVMVLNTGCLWSESALAKGFES